MKRISKSLTLIYMLLAALTLIVIVLYETNILESGIMAEEKQSEFILTALMELVSLGAAFLGLRLFKFKAVHNDLVSRQEPAMMKWGTIRLLTLEVPMLADTLLYYIYMNTTFGYLAIMLLLCLPFVFPSLNRCLAETASEE
ncbi:MAG: hypothetical protein IJQ60_09030 [Prevotella sp.]|nr:hypothetical protein [Prevotella sp.]MBQ7425837.1 hypothetical protein [Prevotella sp.]MBR0264008.1 hypothetical protein [Prevotella sp.]